MGKRLRHPSVPARIDGWRYAYPSKDCSPATRRHVNGQNSLGQKLTDVLDEPKEVQRIGWGEEKLQMLIELAG